VRRRRPPPPSPSEALSALIRELARAPDVNEPWTRAPRPGDRFGKFELVRELGRGGFGVVFEANDSELGRQVAFKAVRPGPIDRARAAFLQREAVAVAKLQHANIVTLYDAATQAAEPYLVFELLRGETLARRIERGPVPVPSALGIALGVAKALEHAHARGVLHRDLKPGNVFLTDQGAVKVLDFGISHVLGVGGPTGSGTPGYMAPEQIRGEPEDARTDVFALGAVIHEMLTGRRAFPDSSRLETPDQVPELPRASGAPAALDRLLRRMLHPKQARRPDDASKVVAALDGIGKSLSGAASRQRDRIAVAAVAASLAVAGGVLIPSCLHIPLRIAIADVENEAGDPELDGLSGMLATTLDQSTWLALVPRERLIRAADAAPGGAPEALGCARAVEAARNAWVRRVLCPSVRRVPGSGELEVVVRAVDPMDGAQEFSFAERSPSVRAIPYLLDGLSVQVRRKLGEPDRSVERGRFKIGDALTLDLEAYRHYLRGQVCAARPVVGEDCGAEFRRAVERDPAFALAHYQLAVWNHWTGGPPGERRASLAYALANAERAPEHDAMLIRAWSAYLGGRLDEALGRYEAVAGRWPEDPHARMQIADIQRRRGAPEAAVEALEAAVRVDPDSPWAAGHLAECLGAAGQLDALRAKARGWESAPRPATRHALSIAYGWLGDVRRAVRVAERGVDLSDGLLARQDLVAASVFADDYAAAEPGLRALAAPGSGARPLGFYGIAAIDAYGGRRRAGLGELDALAREVPAMAKDLLYLTLRVDYVLGDGRPGDAWREVEALRDVSPSDAAEHAAGLALLGDLGHARELARVRTGSVYAKAAEAIAAGRGGDVDGAFDRLRALERTMPCATWRVPPVYLLAEVAAASGRDREAIDAIRRFHAMYVPLTMWRSWAYPRSLVLLARSQGRIGEAGSARETLDRFFGLWAAADPGEPLLAEARAVRAALE
jgi:tetratricopeptide (TPR) repeat protein